MGYTKYWFASKKEAYAFYSACKLSISNVGGKIDKPTECNDKFFFVLNDNLINSSDKKDIFSFMLKFNCIEFKHFIGAYNQVTIEEINQKFKEARDKVNDSEKILTFYCPFCNGLAWAPVPGKPHHFPDCPHSFAKDYV